MDMAAEMQRHARTGKRCCDWRGGAAAGRLGFAEQGAFQIARILIGVERGVMRQGQQAFALRLCAGGDAGDPWQQEGFDTQEGRPSRRGGVEKGAFLAFVPVAVARLEDVGVDHQKPQACFGFDEVGGIHQAARGAAIRRAGVVLAVGHGIGQPEGAFPVQVVRLAEQPERRHRRQAHRLAHAAQLWAEDCGMTFLGGERRVRGDKLGAGFGAEPRRGVLAEGAEHVVIAGNGVEAEVVRRVETGSEPVSRLDLPVICIVAQEDHMADAARADAVQRRVEGHAAFVEGAGRAGGVVPAAQGRAAAVQDDARRIVVAVDVVDMRIGQNGNRNAHALMILSEAMPCRAKTLRVSTSSGACAASAA